MDSEPITLTFTETLTNVTIHSITQDLHVVPGIIYGQITLDYQMLGAGASYNLSSDTGTFEEFLLLMSTDSTINLTYFEINGTAISGSQVVTATIEINNNELVISGNSNIAFRTTRNFFFVARYRG